MKWERTGEKGIDIMLHKNFLFKRRVMAGNTVYLIYKYSDVIYNTHEYFDFLKKQDNILRYGRLRK